MLHRRSGLPATLLAATVAGGGCDSSAPISPSPLTGGTLAVLVSDPVSLPPIAAVGGPLDGRLAANGASNGFVAYVAVAPGTVPGGTSSEISSPRLADMIPATMVDGGFDPVAVPAAAGDTLDISFRLSSGAIVAARAAVPARRRPRVVRTQPTRGRRDVAINSVVAAVFSEPIDPRTLGDSTVRLLKDGLAVAGRVQPAAWSALAVEFAPATPLAPGTTYQLALDERIRDLSGEPLELPDAVEFTTSSGTGTGTLVVAARTTGTDLDPDGYAPRIDGTYGETLGINDSLVLTGIPTGSHAIILDGTRSNCVSTGGIFRTAMVSAGATARVSFELTCYPLPTLTVQVTTTGSDLDTDGYEVRLDGESMGTVPSNGSLAITGPPISATRIALDGMRGNCFAPEQVLAVSPGADGTVTFAVACTPDFAPAGVIAYARGGWWAEPSVIYVANADGSNAVAITDGSAWDRRPAWSPDGSRIAFVRDMWYGAEIFVMNADGSNLVRRASGGTSNDSPTWSPDGRRIAFTSDRSGQNLLYVMAVDGDWASPVQIGPSRGWNVQPAWAPSGETIAFVSDAEGESALYVIEADGSNLRRLDLGGGSVSEPSWLPDGRISVARAPDYRWPPGSLELVAPDGSRRSSLPGTWPSRLGWSSDGVTLAHDTCLTGVSCGIRFMRLDGQRSSVVIPDGFNPVWKP